MWAIATQPLSLRGALRITATVDDRPATFRDTLKGWKEDSVFRESFVAVLRNSPWVGFRWECPPLTHVTVDRPFECVLLESKALDRPPEPDAFAEHFRNCAVDNLVTAFTTLGKDAFLVVPLLRGQAAAYGHLAAFVRHAPQIQIHSLWERVAVEVDRRLSHTPLWLSTAGHGVAWLHVRLDSRPKYYDYEPFREPPA